MVLFPLFVVADRMREAHLPRVAVRVRVELPTFREFIVGAGQSRGFRTMLFTAHAIAIIEAGILLTGSTKKVRQQYRSYREQSSVQAAAGAAASSAMAQRGLTDDDLEMDLLFAAHSQQPPHKKAFRKNNQRAPLSATHVPVSTISMPVTHDSPRMQPLVIDTDFCKRLVVYEDSKLLVLNKPAGFKMTTSLTEQQKFKQLQHQQLLREQQEINQLKDQQQHTSSESSHEQTLVRLAQDYLREKYEKRGRVYTAVVQYLDTMASGVCLLTRSAEATAAMNRTLQSMDSQQLYVCMVHGHVASTHARNRKTGKETHVRTLIHTMEVPLQGDWIDANEQLPVRIMSSSSSSSNSGSRSGGAFVPPHRQAQSHPQQAPTRPMIRKDAHLQYETLSHHTINGQEFTLLRVRLQGSLKHQIRAQLAHMGHPIVGDVLYGRHLYECAGDEAASDQHTINSNNNNNHTNNNGPCQCGDCSASNDLVSRLGAGKDGGAGIALHALTMELPCPQHVHKSRAMRMSRPMIRLQSQPPASWISLIGVQKYNALFSKESLPAYTLYDADADASAANIKGSNN